MFGRRHRRRLAVAVGLVVAVSAVAVGVGAAGEGGVARAGRPHSYCDAARAYDNAGRASEDRRTQLLSPVAALAPHDIAGAVRTLRTTPAGSARHTAALEAWSRFNTNHCCSCIGGPSVPQTLARGSNDGHPAVSPGP